MRFLPLILVIAAIAAASIATTPAATAQPQWRYVGCPPGASIASIARDKRGALYAAATAGPSYDRLPAGMGLYRSADNGRTWSLVAFQGQHVTQIGTTDRGRLFAVVLAQDGNNGDSLATSADGVRWTTRPIQRVWVGRVATDGSILHHIFRYGYGLYTSINGVFSRGNPALETRGAQALAMSPTTTLVIGCDTCPTLVTRDTGATWASTGLRRVRWLAHDGDRTFHALCASGFYYSTNDARTWKRAGDAVPGITAFTADRWFGMLGFGERGMVFHSTDRGRTWRRMNAVDAEITDATFTSQGSIIIGTRSKGLFLRASSGAWLPTGAEIRNAALTSATIAPDGSLLAGADGAIYRSTDGGRSWSGARQRLPFHPDRGTGQIAGRFIARDDGSVMVPYGQHVLRSIDSGATWTVFTSLRVPESVGPYNAPVRDGRNDVAIPSLTIAPDGRFLVATTLTQLYQYAPGSGGWRVLRVNVGDEYDEAGFNAVYTFGDRLYVVDEWRTYVSRDGGASWRKLPETLENTGMGASAMMPDGSLLLANYCGRLYRLTDGAPAWERIGMMPEPVSGLIPAGGGGVLAISSGRIVRSTDGGVHWSDLDRGLENEYVTDVTPARDGRLYAVTSSGIYACDAREAFTPSPLDTIDPRPRFETFRDSIVVYYRARFAGPIKAVVRPRDINTYGLDTWFPRPGALRRDVVRIDKYAPGNYTLLYAVGCSVIDSVQFTIPARR